MNPRGDLPFHKATFIAIGSIAMLAALAFTADSADGVRLGHIALSGVGVVLILLGAVVREANLAKVSWWVLLVNVVAAAVALLMSKP